jgi:hypothetical protein
MRLSAHLLIPLLSMAAACGGSGSSANSSSQQSSSEAAISPVAMSDASIANLVYDNTYSVPAGFYVDDRAGTDRSYTMHHVLDDSGSYELCTDDFAVAMAWEEADNADRSVQGYFVEAFEGQRYFEFARELSYQDDVGNVDDITSPGFARVFKCRYASRDGVDRFLRDGFTGQINTGPIDAEAIRIFSEYLWQFSFFPNSRKKVIATYGTASNTALTHTLQLALSTNQGTGQCDLIEIAEWRFTVNRISGEVTRQFDIVRSFEARYSAGSATICP